MEEPTEAEIERRRNLEGKDRHCDAQSSTESRKGGEIGKVINSIAMSVDGLVDVGGWFVAEGKHDDDSLAQFENAGTPWPQDL